MRLVYRCANIIPTVAGYEGLAPAIRGQMKVINCECGYIAKGDSDEQVVDKIRAHMREDHPALYAQVPREDIFGWIEES